MLNDVKFLYYLFTNYTLEEIKILFQISLLIPKMILQKYYEINTYSINPLSQTGHHELETTKKLGRNSEM